MVSKSRLRATFSFVSFWEMDSGFLSSMTIFGGFVCFASILGKGLKRADHM